MARSSLKIDKTKEKKLSDALDLLEAHVAPARLDLLRLTPENLRLTLAASPILSRIVALSGGLINGLH